MIIVVYTLHATHLEFFVSYSWITFRMVDGCGLRPASLTSFSIAVRNWVIIENSTSYYQQLSSPVDDKLLRKKKGKVGFKTFTTSYLAIVNRGRLDSRKQIRHDSIEQRQILWRQFGYIHVFHRQKENLMKVKTAISEKWIFFRGVVTKG